MPSFTIQSPNLHMLGPVFDFHVALGSAAEAAFRATNTPALPPVQVTAMLDTGATGSVIQQGLPARLGLNPIGVQHINTPSTTNVPCHEYAVRLLLPQGVVVETTVLEAPLQWQHIQFLIGRDVLAHAVLVYIGYGNLFSLSF